jgi:hypothetical protein
VSIGVLRICFVLGCISLSSMAATCQEVLHALVGTISSVNSAAKTIAVRTDDGGESNLKDMIGSRRAIQFDKNIRTDPAAADELKKIGGRTIVYYFGYGDLRTVVALRSLGPGPFTQSAGKVVSFNKKDHALTISRESGDVELFDVASDTVVDTEMGAVGGFEFRPGKGDSVRVTSAVVNGNRTAMFIATVPAD